MLGYIQLFSKERSEKNMIMKIKEHSRKVRKHAEDCSIHHPKLSFYSAGTEKLVSVYEKVDRTRHKGNPGKKSI